MSKSVDKRVVSMEFDNKNFEKGANETLSTLERLQRNSDLDNSGIARGVETIASKFTELGIIGTTALKKISLQAFDTGKQLIESMSGIEAMKAGWGEQTLEIGSVKTILASAGQREGLGEDAVYGYIEDLNKYADQTIYSFSDMTASIGKFTNAGVKLGDAVNAIKGISNEAALSGANAEQASHAMYNFAQALGSGVVRLTDWKSIENANMATVEFKQTLMDSAVKLGTLVEEEGKYVSTTTDMQGNISEVFDATSKFNDSLSAQWMTSEVLVDALSKYSDTTTDLGKRATEAATQVDTFSKMIDTLKEAAGSGWTESFRLIFGRLSEAQALWTGLTNTISDFMSNSSKFRNDILQQWRDRGGRDSFVEGLQNTLKGIISIISPIRDAFRDLFGDVATGLVNGSKSFADFSKKLILNEEQQRKIYKIVTAIGTPIKGVVKIVKGAVKIAWSLVKSLSPLLDIIYKVFDVSYNAIEKLGSAISKEKGNFDLAETIADGISKLQPIIQTFADWVTGALDSIPELDVSWVASVGEWIRGVLPQAQEFFSNFWENLQNFVSGLKDGTSEAGEGIKGFFGSISETLKGVVESCKEINFGTVLDALQVGLLLKGLKDLAGLRKTSKLITENFAGILEGLKLAAQELPKVVSNFAGVLKAKSRDIQANMFLKIAAAIAILTACLIALTFVDQEKLNNVVKSMLAIFISIAVIVAIASQSGHQLLSISDLFKQAIGKFVKSFNLFLKVAGLVALLKSLALAITTMVGTIVALNTVDWEGNGSYGVAALIGILLGIAGAVYVLTKTTSSVNFSQFAGLALLLGSLSGAIAILSGVLAALALIPAKKLVNGIGAMAAVIIMLVGSLVVLAQIPTEKLAGMSKTLIAFSASVALLAAGMLLMVPPLMILSKNNLIVGILQFALAFGILAKLSNSLGEGSKYMARFSLGLGVLAAALVAIGLVAPLIINNAPMIEKAVIVLVQAACTAIAVSADKIVSAALNLVEHVLSSLIAHIPSILDKVHVIIMDVLSFIRTNIPVYAQYLFEIIGEFITAAVRALSKTISIGDASIMGGLLLAVWGATEVLKKIKKNARDAILGAAFGVVIIGMIGQIFTLISIYVGNTSQFIDIAESISLALLAMTACLKILGEIKIKNGAQAAGSLALMGVVFGEIGALLGLVSKLFDGVSEKKIITITASISVAMLAMSACLFITQHINIKSGAQAVASMALMGLVFGEVGALLGLVCKLFTESDVDKALKISEAVSLALVAMGAVLAVLGMIPFTGLIGAVGGMEAFIIALTATMAALGALCKIEGFEELMTDGIAMLGTICQGLGVAVGKIIGGIAEGIVSVLPGIADSITQFVTTMASSKEQFKSFNDEEVSSGADKLIGLLLKFTAASLLGAITDFLSFLTGSSENSLVTTANAIKECITPLKEAFTELATLSPETLTACAAVMEGLANVGAKAPKSGGLLQAFTGTTDWDAFSAGMPKIAEAIVGFQDAISGHTIDATTIKAACDAAGMVGEMAKEAVPREGGLLQKLIGGQDYTKFGKSLTSLGKGIAEFSKFSVDINSETCSAAVEVARGIGDVFNALPRDNGGWQEWAGHKDLASFSRNLPALGTGIAKFNKNITDENGGSKLNAEAMETATNAAKSLAALYDYLPSYGGVLQEWVGSTVSLSSFGTNIASLGMGIMSFATNVKDIKDEDVQKGTNAGQMLANLAASMYEKKSYIETIFSGGDKISLGELGSNVTTLGNGIAEFYNSIKGAEIDPEGFASLVDSISKLATTIQTVSDLGKDSTANIVIALEDLAIEGINAFFDTIEAPDEESLDSAFSTFASTVSKAISDLMTDTSPESLINTMAGLGKFASESFVFGFQLNSKTDANNLMNGIVEQIKSNYDTLRLALTGVKEITMPTSGLEDMLVTFYSEVALQAKNSAVTTIQNDIPILVKTLWSQLETTFKGANKEGFASIVSDIGENYLDAEENQKLQNGILHFKTFLEEKFQMITEAIVNKFKTLGSQISDAILAGKSQIQDAVAVLKSAIDTDEIAKDVTTGMVTGLVNNLDVIKGAGLKVGDTTQAAIKESLKIESPSKVGEEIGRYTDEGVGLGLIDNLRYIYDAGDKVGTGVESAITSALTSMYQLTESDLEFEPTITPVVDLSQVQNGINSINSMTDTGLGYQASLVTSVRAATLSQPDLASNEDVISELKGLRSDLGLFQETLASLGNAQVVMDSGALVGSLINQIDRSLGVRARQGSRR